MVSDLRVYVLIGLFIMVCISLMIFNFVIIRYSRGKNTVSKGKVKRWKAVLRNQTTMIHGVEASVSKHEKLLLKKLPNAENLLVYSQALQYLKNDFPEAYDDYVHKRHATFQKLARIYSRKPRIERTCYADFVYTFPQVAGDTYGQLVEILISYMDDSSIYCRANVLSALCSIGSVQGVVNALRIMNEQSLFMHKNLLTRELLRFKGDKEVLARYLWNERRQWHDNILVPVIQFITQFTECQYREVLFPVLQDASVSAEVRNAIIRYYGKHKYEPVRPILIDFIVNPPDINLAIRAAIALSLYPAADTVTALKNALLSPNWHVRYNASSTLVEWGEKADLLEVLQSESIYKKEIVEYMLDLESALQNVNLQKEREGEDVI
ncbi:MAG: HEAT repeat domain-containing protein [Lachnospiraceae bacterium]|nr:HEAT repeat domain-containing protein [Lachnospiraceae bacterium]